MTEFYDITTDLKNALINSPFVNTVTTGGLEDVDLNKKTIFPLSHIIVNSAIPKKSTVSFNISIIAMDIVDESKESTTNIFVGNDNEQDVLNTQLQVLLRLSKEMTNGQLFSELIQVIGEPTCEPFTDRFENKLAGWTMTFDVEIPNEMTICGDSIPSSCANAFIQNSDGSFSSSLLSGSTTILDDVRIYVYDQDENLLGTQDSPSNIDVNVTVELEPCPPAEVNAEAINSLDEIVTTALLTPTNNQILAPDGIVHIKKENDGTIANVSTPSGNTTEYIIQNNDITVNLANPFSIHAEDTLDIRLHKVNGNDITPNSVTYQGNQNRVTIVAPNSVITLKDSANTTISTTNVQATESANITAPDGAITVNGSSVGGVKSNGTRVLFVKLNGTNSGTYDGVDTINLTSPTPIGGQLLATNQTISYATGDDGDTEAGRNFFTLASNNPFGNTNRFTDVVGGQTYANNVVIDWSTWNGIDGSTVIGYKRTLRANGINWTTAISEANALNFGGFASGWRVCNLREYYNLYNYALPVGTPLNYAPFSLTPLLLWTSQTLIDATTSAFYMTNVGLHSSLIKTHTANISYMARRYYTINGTTLS